MLQAALLSAIGLPAGAKADFRLDLHQAGGAVTPGLEILCAGDLPTREVDEILAPPFISEEDLMRYRSVRGFNYVPSYAENGLSMWRRFDPAVWDRELSWCEKLHANTIRIWLDPRAYEAGPADFGRAFEESLAIAARHELEVIPTLFNCWPSVRPAEWGFGHLDTAAMSQANLRGFEPYVRSVITEHRDDERVLMWDLINEPEFVGDAMSPFIPYYCAYIRGLGTSRALTIGSGGWPLNERFAGLLDVLTLHIYATDAAGYQAAIDGLKAIGRRFAKPVICNECVVGSVDDERHRADTEVTVAAMETNQVGYLVWGLVDGHLAASRPDRQEGSNSYQSFFHTDGTPRAAAAALRW